MSALKERLDVSERGKFRKLEAIVAEGISSFVVVGEALKEIRDARLYRESYKTFEKYVDEKWGMGRNYANKLISSADVSKTLGTTVPKNERVAEIKTERQFRELKDVPAESMEAVIHKAAEIAGDDKITASDLKQARVDILEQTEPEEESIEWVDVDDDEPQEDCLLRESSSITQEARRKLESIASRLELAETLNELFVIIKESTKIRNEVAEIRLRLERETGTLLSILERDFGVNSDRKSNPTKRKTPTATSAFS